MNKKAIRRDIPTKKEVKYYLYKPRGDYYFESKPDGLYLTLYDGHDAHTVFSNLFYARFEMERVGGILSSTFRITRKTVASTNEKKAFNPNEATLEELIDGIQFVPKFIGNVRSFILSRDGIFKRGPYGSETFRQIPIRHAKMELGLGDAPKPVQDAFDYFTGSFDALIKRLAETNEFHTKRIRSESMKKTAAAGPYTILSDLAQDIRRGYASFDWDKWAFAMGHAKGADYVVGNAGETIVTKLIRLNSEYRFSDATDADKEKMWSTLNRNIGMALKDNEIFRGLTAERSFDTWKNYMQSKRGSVVSELVKIAKEVMGYGYHKTYGGDPYWLTLKYPGHCDKCHKPLARGERAYYYPRTRSMFGEACGHGQEAEQDFHSQVEMEEGHLV